MNKPVFITGIGTDIGKTVVASIITEALCADYWKPVQSGLDGLTDARRLSELVSNPNSYIHPERYRLALPASPHFAAAQENQRISLETLHNAYSEIIAVMKKSGKEHLIVEGAGGLMVPLNEREFMTDLIRVLDATVILVSRNYLGSINHSLLTAAQCRQQGFRVAGWIFNDEYIDYERDIALWSGFPVLGSIPFTQTVNSAFVREQAARLRPTLLERL